MSTITLRQIIEATEAEYGISSDRIRSGESDLDAITPRLVFNYLARKLTSASHRQVCEFLAEKPLDSGRSVRRERRCKELLARDPELRFEVARVVARLTLDAVAAPLPRTPNRPIPLLEERPS